MGPLASPILQVSISKTLPAGLIDQENVWRHVCQFEAHACATDFAPGHFIRPHRVLGAHDMEDSHGRDRKRKPRVLKVHDRGLYPPGQLWLNERHIIGRAKGFLPYVGMVTIVMNDYPYLKFLLIGVLGLFVLSNRE